MDKPKKERDRIKEIFERVGEKQAEIFRKAREKEEEDKNKGE